MKMLVKYPRAAVMTIMRNPALFYCSVSRNISNAHTSALSRSDSECSHAVEWGGTRLFHALRCKNSFLDWGQPLNQGVHLSGPQAKWHFPHEITKQPPWLLWVRAIACNYITPNFVRTITEIKLGSLSFQTMGFSGTRLIFIFPSGSRV